MDTLFLSLLFTDVLIASIFHTITRTFIKNKPEGRKTVIAKLHITLSYILQIFSITMTSLFVYRIIFGVIPINVLSTVKVLTESCVMIIFCLFLSVALIKIFFMIDFGRMSSISEDRILTVIYSIIGGWVIGGVALELVLRWFSVN